MAHHILASQSERFDSVIVGVVEAVNERGIKINGEWKNVSKFAVGCVLPERGAAVSCTLDKAGFLRNVEVVSDAGPAPIAGGSDTPSPSTKDRTITRLAVLKAAAEYSASKPSSSSADVLKIAACWERWVNRSDAEPQEDLTDAL